MADTFTCPECGCTQFTQEREPCWDRDRQCSSTQPIGYVCNDCDHYVGESDWRVNNCEPDNKTEEYVV